MAKKPETRFKERIRPHLDALPRSWWFKVQLIALCGIPDFIGCVNGHFVALELKKDELEDARPLQSWVLSKIIAAGGLGLVTTPANWEHVHRWLKDLAAGRSVEIPRFPPSLLS